MIMTMIAILGITGAAYAYDKNERAQIHEELTHDIIAGNIELDLQRVNLELKLLRTIKERRALTADEQDRKQYLIDLRKALLATQKKS
jgi:hypothetical protein